jgi:hypothetical protein
MTVEITYRSGNTDTLTTGGYSADLLDALTHMSRHQDVMRIEAFLGKSTPILIQDGVVI